MIKPKTVLQWLETLPEPHKTWAIEQTTDGEKTAYSLTDALLNFAEWDNTREKAPFWKGFRYYYIGYTLLPYEDSYAGYMAAKIAFEAQQKDCHNDVAEKQPTAEKKIGMHEKSKKYAEECGKETTGGLTLEVYDSGDPSVGIPDASWQVQCPFCFQDADHEELEQFREGVMALYSNYCNGRLIATYCFEAKAIEKALAEAELEIKEGQNG